MWIAQVINWRGLPMPELLRPYLRYSLMQCPHCRGGMETCCHWEVAQPFLLTMELLQQLVAQYDIGFIHFGIQYSKVPGSMAMIVDFVNYRFRQM